MSSHREAPGISKDPAADNTDTYAFVSPDQPDTVTIITNYLPFEAPFGGPNFFEFAEDVQYDINIDQTGDGTPDVIYRFSFDTEVGDAHTFLYNTGTIDSIDSPAWNRKQFYSVTRIAGKQQTKLGHKLTCPPCNIGPASTPDYPALAAAAIHDLGGGRTVFAGQRSDGFYVDLGAIFDLGDLRPLQELHVATMAGAAPGVNDLNGFSVHSIAIQVPISDLASSANPVIGVWGTASRRMSLVREPDGKKTETGPWVQVSRLGNPLFNEVIVAMADKNRWNSLTPADDSQFAKRVSHPELAKLLPSLYPGVFPNLDALNQSGAPRADLVAILLTGLPPGVVPGFTNFTGSTQADELRLNTAIAPASQPNILGVIAGDLAGYPNGRRVFDDVVTISLRAIAGVTYPLVAPDFQPDPAAGAVTDGLAPSSLSVPFLNTFPYLGVPVSGYSSNPL
jgi:hypothetical protein